MPNTQIRHQQSNRPMTENQGSRLWGDLSAQERLQLREEYGYYLDRLPPTCCMDTKVDRFCIWLNERGIHYEP